MKHLHFFLPAIGVLIFSCYAFSQNLPPDYVPLLKDNSIEQNTPSLYQVGEVKGTAKNKVAFLPKLEYPREAIANDVEGDPLTDIFCARSATVVVSPTATSRFTGVVGNSKAWSASTLTATLRRRSFFFL